MANQWRGIILNYLAAMLMKNVSGLRLSVGQSHDTLSTYIVNRRALHIYRSLARRDYPIHQFNLAAYIINRIPCLNCSFNPLKYVNHAPV